MRSTHKLHLPQFWRKYGRSCLDRDHKIDCKSHLRAFDLIRVYLGGDEEKSRKSKKKTPPSLYKVQETSHRGFFDCFDPVHTSLFLLSRYERVVAMVNGIVAMDTRLQGECSAASFPSCTYPEFSTTRKPLLRIFPTAFPVRVLIARFFLCLA